MPAASFAKRHLAIAVLIALIVILGGAVLVLSFFNDLPNSNPSIRLDSVDGTWAGVAHNKDGGTSYYILVLKQDGTTVTGQAQAQNGAGSGYAQVHGSYDGNILTLEEFNPTGTGWEGICNWHLNLHTVGSLATPQMAGNFQDIRRSDGSCDSYGTVALDRR